MENKSTYIIAVSGGVDSVVLLDKLMSVKAAQIDYIVAHFDHGIRRESGDDAEFVNKLAGKYKLKCKIGKENLGKNASEDEAREARYKFLYKVMESEEAEAIITAHHKDDVVETMVVNILRGTGPRGLIGFTRQQILRPLVNRSKQDLIDYAKEHGLKWREDKTNLDTKYLRNKVRADLSPKLKPAQNELLDIRAKVTENYREIDDQIVKLLVQTMEKNRLIRSRFVSLPYIVQRELVATWLRLVGIEIDKKMVERSVMAIKTLRPGKHLVLNKKFKLYVGKTSVSLKS